MSERVTPRKLIAQRIALVAFVGVVAIAFLSSSLLAGVIAVVTIAAVLFDTLALSRLDARDTAPPDPAPRQITVDLSRRS